MSGSLAMKCFISYTHADLSWAEWIAWQLEERGLQAVLQAWDFRAGCNFILEMDRASKQAQRTIAVLSASYINAAYTHPEWASAFARDPTGESRILLPIRVRECTFTGLLAQVVYIDLVGLTEIEAKTRLLSQVHGERGKPLAAPRFPGVSRGKPIAAPPYPPADAAPETRTPIASAPLIIGKETELLRKAEQDLLPYVGPVAKVIVRRAVAKTGTKSDLYLELAAAIPTESERQKFLRLAADQPGSSTSRSPESSDGSSQHQHFAKFSISLLEQLRRELIAHIGPVANIAIDKESGSATTVEDLYRRLGEHVPAGAERSAFLERCRKHVETCRNAATARSHQYRNIACLDARDLS